MALSTTGRVVFVANTAKRNFELGSPELFFTKPVNKFHYLFESSV